MANHPITSKPISRHKVKKHAYKHASVAATAFPSTNPCTQRSTRNMSNQVQFLSKAVGRLAYTDAARGHGQHYYQPTNLECNSIPKQRVDSDVFCERCGEHWPHSKTAVSLLRHAITNAAPATTFQLLIPLMHSMSSAAPNPHNTLNSGAAKHPVIAILVCPCLANAAFAKASPTEFPHASAVCPSSAAGTSNMYPNDCSSATTSPIGTVNRRQDLFNVANANSALAERSDSVRSCQKPCRSRGRHQ